MQWAVWVFGLHACTYLVHVSAWSDYLKRVAGELPQKRLAELAGVDPSQVSRWMAGSTSPTAKTVTQLAAGLGLDESEALAAAGHLQHPISPEAATVRIAETAIIPIEFSLDYLKGVIGLVNMLPLEQLDPEVQEQVATVRASTGSMLMMVSNGSEPGAAPRYHDVLLELVMATFVNEPQTRQAIQQEIVNVRNYRDSHTLTNMGAYRHIANDPRLKKPIKPEGRSLFGRKLKRPSEVPKGSQEAEASNQDPAANKPQDGEVARHSHWNEAPPPPPHPIADAASAGHKQSDEPADGPRDFPDIVRQSLEDLAREIPALDFTQDAQKLQQLYGDRTEFPARVMHIRSLTDLLDRVISATEAHASDLAASEADATKGYLAIIKHLQERADALTS